MGVANDTSASCLVRPDARKCVMDEEVVSSLCVSARFCEQRRKAAALRRYNSLTLGPARWGCRVNRGGCCNLTLHGYESWKGGSDVWEELCVRVGLTAHAFAELFTCTLFVQIWIWVAYSKKKQALDELETHRVATHISVLGEAFGPRHSDLWLNFSCMLRLYKKHTVTDGNVLRMKFLLLFLWSRCWG